MRGHIRKRGNTWSVVVDLGRDHEGRRRQKWHSGFRTKRDAERAMAEILGAIQSGSYAEPSRQTLGEYLQQWVAGIEGSVKPGTWRSYRTNVKHHVIPRLGGLPLRNVSALQLNGLYGELLREGRADGCGGLSPRTALHPCNSAKGAPGRGAPRPVGEEPG